LGRGSGLCFKPSFAQSRARSLVEQSSAASSLFQNSTLEEKLKASMESVLCNVSAPTFLTEFACIYQHVALICLVAGGSCQFEVERDEY
jgi:hypothetical protein